MPIYIYFKPENKIMDIYFFFNHHYIKMGIKIPEHKRSAIIDAWLRGETRDNIALEIEVAGGTVSNVIEEWQNKIGAYDANNLRKLGLALKKAKISSIQCVNGLRIINIINKLGIDEEHLFDFLIKLYNKSKEQKSDPANIVRLVKVINAYPEINSLNEIPKIIDKRRQEKIKLDADIFYRKHEIEKVDNEIERKKKEIQVLQNDLESSRREIHDQKKDFLLFQNVKEELKKHDISIHSLVSLINVIKIFDEMHYRPLTILCEFSDITAYRKLVENKDKQIKQRVSHIQDLKAISDNYEMKIISNEPIIQSLKQLENLGFNASDIKNLYLMFSKISKIYGLNKKEIKIRFFRCINYYFNDLLPLQKDIGEKINKIFILDNEISSRRKIIEESQPIVFAILQHLVSSGFNEHYILKAFKIFKTDLCNKMPYGDRTYSERLSKDLNRYPTVRDTLDGLNTKILMKKSSVEKLSVDKSNLEAILFSLVISVIYFYSTLLLNAQQIQIQQNLIKRILFNSCFRYLLPILLLFGIVIKEPEKFVKSKFNIKQNDNYNDHNKKKEKKKKVVKERKKELQRRT